MRHATAIGIALVVLGLIWTTPVDAQFMRGDANNDTKVDLADSAAVLGTLFFNLAIVCDDAADSNDDGDVNIADSIYLVQYLFLMGAAPPAPVLLGPDPTPDPLTCDGANGPIAFPPVDHALVAETVTVGSGSTFKFDVTLIVEPGAPEVEGFSFTVEYDSAVVTTTGLSGTSGDLPAGPAASLVEFYNALYLTDAIAIGAILDMLPPFDQQVFGEGVYTVSEIEFSVIGSAGTSTPVVFSDSPIDSITVADGFARRPDLQDGLIEVSAGVLFRRGDINDDGDVSIADPIVLLDELLSGGAATPCQDAGDVNDDGMRDIADAISLLTYLFASGVVPAPGASTCGVDPTSDALTPCVTSACP